MEFRLEMSAKAGKRLFRVMRCEIVRLRWSLRTSDEIMYTRISKTLDAAAMLNYS